MTIYRQMIKWTKCAVQFLRISRPGVRVPSIAPSKIPRLTVEIRCKSWDFLFYNYPETAGMCLICALRLKKCLAVCLTECLVLDARRGGFVPVYRLFDSKKPVRCVAGRALVLYGVQYPFKMFSASSVFAVSSSSACDLSIASMMLHRSV